jgi:hypothetical protein
MGTGVAIPELLSLLAEEVTRADLVEWVERHPAVARLEGEVVYPATGGSRRRPERRSRGEAYRKAAREFVDGPLAPLGGLARCVAVTGSTAYGEPEGQDDIDFLVITRSGSAWLYLSYVYLLLRLGRGPRLPGGPPELCFNFVQDDASAHDEFRRPQGLLVAREALSVRVMSGAEYYHGLLRSMPWLAREVPRFVADGSGRDDAPVVVRAPWPVRLANAAIFPFLATYLQLVGLARNARFRRLGQPDRTFATRTTPSGVAFRSARFERLRARYDGPAPPRGAPAPTARTPAAAGAGPIGGGGSPAALQWPGAPTPEGRGPEPE